MIKISIITVTLNSESTIRDTLNSVLSQSYKNIEHIVVDGGSIDGTKKILKKYPNKNKKIYSYKNSGIYSAINYGIKKSSGDYITILNSDDFYNSNTTIQNVVKEIKKNKDIKIFFGSIVYFKNNEFYKILRFYSPYKFQRSQMLNGIMPPHPATFVKKEIYQENNLYNKNFKIASDFEFFLRIIYIKKIKFKIIKLLITRMRLGGISSKNIFSYIISTKEILKSFKLNGIKNNIFRILLRFPLKIVQIINFNKNYLNKDFKVFSIHFDENKYYKKIFYIINNFQKIPFQKNFILSAMNLAFLGYYAANKIQTFKNSYQWIDGIWAEKYINEKKKPGRELIKNLKIPNSFKSITIIGNISKNSKSYIYNKFKKKIIHIELPYDNILNLKKIPIKLKNDTLTFITLPTPKQEQLSYKIAKDNKVYKIICIGASIAIASGDEKEVPKFLKNYEFLWRLKSDTIRRLLRITQTIYYYYIGKFILKKYSKIILKKID